jgi:hypothetical protein
MKAVKSKDYENLYFMSGDLEGAGLEGDNDIATFATNADITSSKGYLDGIIMSVNGVASEFYNWPDGRKSKFNLSTSDDGVEASKDCLK